tara:strand:- start:487 stop:801 length:315 start_codon:yes stop_codon:yes gene_type:complete
MDLKNINLLELFSENNLFLGLVKAIENYADKDETNKDETNNNNNQRMTRIFGVVFCIINVILCIYAITIALKCAGNFITKMCNLIFAMCVPFLYIIYRLARPCV